MKLNYTASNILMRSAWNCQTMSPVLLTEVRLLITANENNNQTHAHGRHLNHGGGRLLFRQR